MTVLDLEITGWLQSRLDRPWAFPALVEPIFGLTFEDIPALEAAIIATPEVFVDGTPVYVTTINYDTPLEDDPVSEPGWVIVYSLTPMPLTPPSTQHLKYWIEFYEPINGTSWIDADGDGQGEFYVPIDGDPAPTNQINPGALCTGTMSANELDVPLHPISQVSGEGTGFDATLLTDVGNIL